jgi:hypothetical protein
MTTDFLSGLAPVDRFLDDGFEAVPGMSSRFATAIVARLCAIQAGLGVHGGFVEIGAFMGRFLIAIAKSLRPEERAIGIDHFEWPGPHVLARFEGYCRAHGLDPARALAIKADSRTLDPAAVLAAAGGPARIVHVDGEHTVEHLMRDLALAAAIRHPRGVIVVDDMLHPGYPQLPGVVIGFLESRPDLCVAAVIDRQDIVGAAKFVIAARADFAEYETALRDAFPQFVWGMRAEFPGYAALVLTPRPMLAAID